MALRGVHLLAVVDRGLRVIEPLAKGSDGACCRVASYASGELPVREPLTAGADQKRCLEVLERKGFAVIPRPPPRPVRTVEEWTPGPRVTSR
jgi:hypothetical protein